MAHSRLWSIPGALKNAIDWASLPWGTNSFAQKPSAMIGTSPGTIGTAVAQQNLRNEVEAYIQTEPGLFADTGEVTDESGAISCATTWRSSASSSCGSSPSCPGRPDERRTQTAW